MNTFENQLKSETSVEEPRFHFEGIKEIEPAVISLVKQLKEKFSQGEYDTFISDDVGGRIPTLILRKIFKELNPDKKIETVFVASGKTYFPTAEDPGKYKQLQEYLKKATNKTKKALLVTQFIFTGKTLLKMTDALEDAGVDDFDMATIDAMPHFDEEEDLRQRLGNNNLYIGGTSWSHLHEEHEELGGVRKTKEYSPFPRRAVDIFANEGRELSWREYKEIFGIKDGDLPLILEQKAKNSKSIKEYERRMQPGLEPGEAEKIQKNINLARQDVVLLSDRVIKQVWN